MNSTTHLATTLTQKYQATIPLKVRELLELGKGDKVAFEISEDNKVILRKSPPLDKPYTDALQGTLTEWATPADDEAYADL